MKVAIASAGLGNVYRGVESWSEELAYALHEKHIPVKLYKGNGKANSEIEKVIPCVVRDSVVSNRILRIMPRFAWRFGFGSTLQIEGTTFGFNLLSDIRREKYDIVHTQEPPLVELLRLAKRLGLIKSKIILGHGTNETMQFLKQLECVQFLTPYHLEQADKSLGCHRKGWFAIPNFVDVDKFKPVPAGKSMRAELNIPDDAFVIISVAAVKKVHKRIDFLIQEISRLKSSSSRPIYFLIVGGRTADTDELVNMGREMLGERIIFQLDIPHKRMPEFYRVADLFVLGSLHEMCAIVFFEAMASQIPVLGNDDHVISWIIGDGGDVLDMSQEGALGEAISKYLEPEYRLEKGRRARARAEKMFSKDVVVEEIIAMYKQVILD